MFDAAPLEQKPVAPHIARARFVRGGGLKTRRRILTIAIISQVCEYAPGFRAAAPNLGLVDGPAAPRNFCIFLSPSLHLVIARWRRRPGGSDVRRQWKLICSPSVLGAAHRRV